MFVKLIGVIDIDVDMIYTPYRYTADIHVVLKNQPCYYVMRPG
jgi:hypothetical protein